MAMHVGNHPFSDADLRALCDPWNLAKERFYAGLNDDEKKAFDTASLENLFYRASNVDRADEGSSKTRRFIRVIQPLVSAVDDYSKAFDAYSNTASLYLAPIWGSIRIVLILASKHANFYSRIVETFGRIGDVLPRLRDYQRIFDGRKHIRLTHVLSKAYLQIITLCAEFRTMLQTQKKSTMTRIFKPLSSPLHESLEAAVEQFRSLRCEVEKEAELCHMIEEQESREMILRNHAAAEARKREIRQQELIKLLSAINYRYKHNRMRRARYCGTGSWLKSLPQYNDWLKSDSPAVLFCYGIPGSGKSVLMSSMIDERLSQESLSNPAKAVFYYCDYSDKRTLDPVSLFNSISQQLLQQMRDLPQSILEVLEDICQNCKMDDLGTIVDLCQCLTWRSSSITLFVDGLDELIENDRKIVLRQLWALLDSANAHDTKLKLCISSREDPTYSLSSSSIPHFKFRIGVDAISGDIEHFVRHSVQDLRERGSLVFGDPTLGEEIIQALTAGAQGMFLWVKFQLDDLCQAETDGALKEILDDLPSSLGETYNRLLGRIDGSQRRELIRRMFAWIIYARRPLHANELREAVAFTSEDTFWDPTKIPNDINRLVRASGNLVVIDDDSGNICLAHYTVQQYLLTHDSSSIIARGFKLQAAEAELGHICIAYLSFSDFERQVTRYDNDSTTKFLRLETIVRHGPFSESSSANRIGAALKALRGNHVSATNIDYARYVNLRQDSSGSSLTSKYLLLAYITRYWLSHTRSISFLPEDRYAHSSRNRSLTLFQQLVREKNLLFDLRPWDGAEPLKAYPFRMPNVSLFGWALYDNHVQVLSVPDNFQMENHDLRNCLSCVNTLLEARKKGRSNTTSRIYIFECWSDIHAENVDSGFTRLSCKNDPRLWLCQQLSVACRKGHLDVLDKIVAVLASQESSSRRHLLIYLLAEGCEARNTTTFRFLCSRYDAYQMDAMGIINLLTNLEWPSMDDFLDVVFQEIWAERNFSKENIVLLKVVLTPNPKSRGIMALFNAISQGSLGDVSLLLDSGVSDHARIPLNCLNLDNITANSEVNAADLLHLDKDHMMHVVNWAVLNRQDDILRKLEPDLLSARGSDKAFYGTLHCAVLVQSLSLVTFLCELDHARCYFNSTRHRLMSIDARGRTPLGLAEELRATSRDGARIVEHIRFSYNICR